MNDPALVIGCGYLGRRVAARWLAAGRAVAALTRSRAAEFAAAGLTPVTGDVLDPAGLRHLPRASTTLYAVGLDRSAGKPMREVYVQGLANVLDALPPGGTFVYVSSTSVYGQTGGEWVDETSPTEPTEESGRVVLDAETLLRKRRPDAVILRFVGLYGPGRVLRRAALLRGEPLAGDADKWLNLVHVADGAAAVLAAEAHAPPGETYTVSDGTPVTRRDFYTRAAELLAAPPAAFAPPSPPGHAEPNRRVSNRKARGLPWTPAFPSYREGLADAVSGSAG